MLILIHASSVVVRIMVMVFLLHCLVLLRHTGFTSAYGSFLNCSVLSLVFQETVMVP
jgi:hypothetical protein